LTATDFAKAKSKFLELGCALAVVGSGIIFMQGLEAADVGDDEDVISCSHVASDSFKEAGLNGMAIS